jgi:hypothetical protein
VPAAQISRLHPGLVLLQDRDDLLFRVPLALHRLVPSSGARLQFVPDQFKGATSTAAAFALALALPLASSAAAAPLQQPSDVIVKVREACGAGMHRVNGVCVTTHARRAARRCAAGVTCNR